MATKRVYHPTSDNFHDVPAEVVKDWTDAGWTTDKPKHVTDEDRAPGVFFVAEPVREPEPAPVPKAEKPKADKA